MTETASAVRHGHVQIGAFGLESGATLANVEIAYERTGPRDAPVIFVCHALTGNQYTVGDEHEPGWWAGLIGEDKWIDTTEWQVITMNVLGGCNGSTGPQSINPETGQPYRSTFPFITVRDIVNAHYQALKELGVYHLKAVIGASLGGMQALEWGVLYPHYIDKIIPIAVTPYLSDYAISYNTIARNAIVNDPAWNGGNYDEESPPENGLGLARMLGMVTYRSAHHYNERFSRNQQMDWGTSHVESTFEVESYLNYQGEKLSRRFDANSYLYLLKAMDSHNIGRGRGGWQEAINQLNVPVYAFGFLGDLLYPPDEVKQLVGSTGDFYEINTLFGHDGFLVQFDKWAPLLIKWLKE